MEQLRETLNARTQDCTVDLLDASKQWACYCLDNNSGEVLAFGLAISKALADYHFAIQGRGEEAGS